jgi:hypothetical protein
VLRIRLAPVALLVLALPLTACGGGGDEDPDAAGTTTGQTRQVANLAPVKDYLVGYTGRLTGFTGEFLAQSRRYHALAERAGFDEQRLWREERDELRPLISSLKESWIAGNPLYERVEGIVAGTPSLAEYDVILDAGSSAAEDPESAVPFDLELADGRVLAKPGNLYNLTEGALWGTLPDALRSVAGSPADLDGNGTGDFGEVLPDAAFLLAAAEAFDRYAKELDRAAHAWSPRPSDAMTALVVMVPTMSEYFGQWKESRFVRGDAAASESFNVVSRLSDVGDILASLEVVYDGVEPLTATVGAQRSRQTEQELADLSAFVDDLRAQERAGKRFTPEQAETLGAEAQSRATAIAGQVSQQAAELQIPIDQS